MRYHITTFTLILGLLSTTANAQNYNYQNTQYSGAVNNQIGISSGVKLTVPFGTNANQSKPEARLGLTLSLDNRPQRHWTDSRLAYSTDILELGFFENGDPNIMLMGQELYEPLFGEPQMNAKTEDGAKAEGKSNKLIYIAGGAVALTGLAIVLVKESSDDLLNCNFSNERNVPECR